VLRWEATPLDDGDDLDGYRIVGTGTRGTDSVRQKMVKTLYLFGDRRLLLLAPTLIVAGLTGSLTVAAFHQVCRGISTQEAQLSQRSCPTS